MFGILTYKKFTTEQYNQFRLNYCGTCKAIGKIYGQKERLFLNFDAVFLSELLDAISKDENKFQYIKPNTCFSLPKEINQIPFFLKYSASVNVLLACYKIEDNIVDNHSIINIWKPLKYAENINFKKAKKFLKEAGVSISFIEETIQNQFNIEKQNQTLSDFQKTLEHYCTPTGKITGEIFRASVSQLENYYLESLFKDIGKNFGEIIYLIDAIDDHKKDKQKGNFNILFLDEKLSLDEKINLATNQININLKQLKLKLESLPIQNSEKISFYDRLATNIQNRLNKLCSCNVKGGIHRYTLRERYNLALKFAKNKNFRMSNKFLHKILYPSFSVILICLFIVFPNLAYAQIHEAGCCCGWWCCPCSGEEGGHEVGKRACECTTDCYKSECGPACCTIIGIGAVCGYCCGGNGNSVEGPKIITITKIVEIDKGCGGCK